MRSGRSVWGRGWGVLNAPMLNILLFWGYTLDPYNSSYTYLVYNGIVCKKVHNKIFFSKLSTYFRKNTVQFVQ